MARDNLAWEYKRLHGEFKKLGIKIGLTTIRDILMSHYNFTRPHQGKEIDNKVLDVDFTPSSEGEIKREKKLGGIISHYYRAAA